MLTLSPNPPAIRNLLNADLDRLESLYGPKVLPRGPRGCPTCKGTGHFRWKTIGGEPAEWQCNCSEQYQLHLFLLNAGIDLRYQRLSWADIEGVEPEALAMVVDYIDHDRAYVNQGLGLVLHGVNGTGKTLLATLLLKRLLKKSYDGYFTTFQTLISNFTEGWYNQDQRKWFAKRIYNAGLLVIDDIGHEDRRRLETVVPMLDEMVRARVAGARPTFLTTNLSLKDVKDLYLNNVMSLLMGSSIMHEFTGDDYRSREAEETRKMARDGLCRPIVLE